MMRARIPLDVDLEDRLIYGLTPVRFGYLVLACLCGMATWSALPAPVPVRLPLALAVVGIGAAFAWGKWRGRTPYAWIVDGTLFVSRNYRFRLRFGAVARVGGGVRSGVGSGVSASRSAISSLVAAVARVLMAMVRAPVRLLRLFTLGLLVVAKSLNAALEEPS